VFLQLRTKLYLLLLWLNVVSLVVGIRIAIALPSVHLVVWEYVLGKGTVVVIVILIKISIFGVIILIVLLVIKRLIVVYRFVGPLARFLQNVFLLVVLVLTTVVIATVVLLVRVMQIVLLMDSVLNALMVLVKDPQDVFPLALPTLIASIIKMDVPNVSETNVPKEDVTPSVITLLIALVRVTVPNVMVVSILEVTEYVPVVAMLHVVPKINVMVL